MSVEKQVESELADIFRRFGSPDTEQRTAMAVQVSGVAAGRDVRQFTINITGAFDPKHVCVICKTARGITGAT